LSRKNWQRLLAIAAIAIGLCGLYYLHVASGIKLNRESLRSHIAALGVFGPLAVIAIMTFRPFLFLPSMVVMMASGIAFGPVLGTVCNAVGGVLGALLIFGIARALGRETVQSYLGIGSLRNLEEFLVLRGMPWLTLYTAIPISPLTPVFAGSGLSRMNLAMFTMSVTLGFIPRSALFAILGKAVEEPTPRNVTISAILVLAAAAASWLSRRWLSARPSASE
jgi:uncharacterized membrane protein YdjX (TVP38/TMEM64 family)